MRKVVLHQPCKASGVTGILIPRPRKVATATSTSESLPSISTEADSTVAASGRAAVILPPLASIPAMASLPELVREFGQIKTRLRSPMSLFEPQNLQDQHRVFNEWMQRDFTAFFSLKALQEAENALTKLYKAQQMSKWQYESFISFFEL
ncbi:hypothetical protein ACFX2I_009493 [Malus domestica]